MDRRQDTGTVLKPVEPVYGKPILHGDEARRALKDFIERERERFREAGVDWDQKAVAEAIYRFRASEAYLGPLSAASWAGWAARELKIITKKGRLVPFMVNSEQYALLEIVCQKIREQKPVRIVILKARQIGFSTLVQALQFWATSLKPFTNATTIAHKSQATGNLHAMYTRFLRYLEYSPRTVRSNRRGVIFAPPHESTVVLDTAQEKEAGRSGTNQLVHGSEVAFWPWAEDTWLSLVQTVGDEPGTMIIMESTANGVGGLFYDTYMRARSGKSGYEAVFFPWWQHPEYQVPLTTTERNNILKTLDPTEKNGIDQFAWTAEQIAWRRRAISDKCQGDVAKFRQEYPATDLEAFVASGTHVFDPELVSRRIREAEQRAPIFIGTITGGVS